MDMTNILDAIKLVRETLEQKGWYVYSYQSFTVTDSMRMEFHATIRPPYGGAFDEGWKIEDNIDIRESCTSVDDLRACMHRFIDRAVDQLMLAEYMEGRYRQKLIDMADEGERLGFALEYTQVLRETAKRLSTNIITNRTPRVPGVSLT